MGEDFYERQQRMEKMLVKFMPAVMSRLRLLEIAVVAIIFALAGIGIGVWLSWDLLTEALKRGMVAW